MMPFVLYIHIIAACAWVGGSILLFGLGLSIRDKSAQEAIYGVIGPFYGYFETAWLAILAASGAVLLDKGELWSLIGTFDTELGRILSVKMALVAVLTAATIVHLAIAFATHRRPRTRKQALLSRAGSLAIFVLNLVIIAYAIGLRTILNQGYPL